MYYFLQSQASVLPTKISGKIEILMKGNERCKNSDDYHSMKTRPKTKCSKNFFSYGVKNISDTYFILTCATNKEFLVALEVTPAMLETSNGDCHLLY